MDWARLPGRRKPTLLDIAEWSGVSVTTVARVLNDVPGAQISDSTRVRVRAAAAALAHRLDDFDRTTWSRRTMTIGLLSDRMATSPFTGRMIHGAQDAAAQHGALLIALDHSDDARLRERQARALIERAVDGIVYAAAEHCELSLPAAAGNGPAVLLNGTDRGARRTSVVPDERYGARCAVNELLDHGHRSIGFVVDAASSPARDGRLAGYRQALAQAGVDAHPRWIAQAGGHADGGFQAASTLFALPAALRPTAIFCGSDQMAMGVYQAAAERRLDIPGDVSVVGFDDQQLIAADLRPGLTTVALPHYEMGVWAVDALMHAVSEPRAAVQQAALPCPLIRRHSVGGPPR